MTLTRIFPPARFASSFDSAEGSTGPGSTGSTEGSTDPEGLGRDTVDGLDAASRAWLLAHYRRTDAAYLRVNMIGSLNGSATGDDGTSDTLTSRLDRRILGVIRELSDVVLVGAGSVRAEGYVVPARAALAVVTASGDLSGHRLEPRPVDETGGGHPVLVLCARANLDRAEATAGGRATIVPLDDAGGEIPLASIVRALHDRGLTRIVCEGGPILAGRLVAADLVDEFCLSTSPQMTLGGRPLLDSAEAVSRRFSLRQLLVDDAGATYARWSRARPANG